MRALSLIILALGLLLVAAVSRADAVLSWTLPTERENGMVLAPSEITAVTLYRNGSRAVTLPGTATSYTVADVCTAGIVWTATATAGSESAQSNPAEQPIDEVGCRPKKPAGLSF